VKRTHIEELRRAPFPSNDGWSKGSAISARRAVAAAGVSVSG
jgi:hypothetical protein